MANLVELPYEYFPSFSLNRPVFNGSIYVGEPGLDPEVPANQKSVTLKGEGFEVVVSQPVNTSSGGVPDYNGSPAQILVDGNYSLKVLDKNGAQVYYIDDAFSGAPIVIGDDTIVNVYDTVAELKTQPLDVGVMARTKGYYAAGDGGGAIYLIAASQAVDGFGDHLLSNGNTAILQIDGEYNLAQYGAVLDGVADDTSQYEACCAAAAGDNVNRVFIPSNKMLVNGSLSSDCVIVGSDTEITGMVKNHAGLIGCKVNGFRQDILNQHLPESSTDSAKLVYRTNVDDYLVMTRKPGAYKRGVIFQLEKGITTTTNSLGVDQELLRCTWVHNNTGIYAWNDTGVETGAGWSDFSVNDTYLGHTGDDTQRAPTIRRTSTNADYVEYTITVEQGTIPNVAILGTAGSAAFQIHVDGVLYTSGDGSDWDGEVNTIPLDIASGNRVIRVTHNDGSGTLYVFGVNLRTIGNVSSFETYSNWAAYRDINLPRYVQNEGAHDYAIFDDDSNLWGGSFHGGETAQVAEFIFDGVADALPVFSDGGLSCKESVYLRHRTTIDWTGVGSGTVKTESLLYFRDGQVELDVAFDGDDDGDFYAQRFYTCMNGLHENFDNVIFPTRESITLDGPEILFGQTSKVGLRHAASNAIAITDTRLYGDSENDRGGIRIDPISGSYNKIYYGHVLNGRRLIKSLAANTIRTFK